MRTIASFFYRNLPLMIAALFCEMPTLFAQTPIACDGDVSATLATNAEVDIYTFNADAGDVVIIRMQADGSTIQSKIQLTGPGISQSDVGYTTEAARIGAVQLAGGAYIISASDEGSNNSGAYGLSLQIIKSSCAQPIACGATLNTSFGLNTELDAFTFFGTTCDTVLITMTGSTGALHESLWLYAPNGSLIASSIVTTNAASALLNVPLYLYGGGDYIIVTSETEGDNTGAYTLSLNCTGPPATLSLHQVPIPGGTYTASVSISSAGRVDNGTSVLFRAGTLVELLPNFEVQLGGVFEVLMEGCF